MNIIQYIKNLFVTETEPEPAWDIHWYAHVITSHNDITWVRFDHIGIVQQWSKEPPRLGEYVNFVPRNDAIYANQDLPYIMKGLVTEVRHNSESPGGSITVYDDVTIYVMENGKARMPDTLSEYLTDEAFAKVQEQRKLIKAGELPWDDRVTVVMK